ncbi:MAG: hypothetical protein AB1432_13760 [Bacteroidota bacterium]
MENLKTKNSQKFLAELLSIQQYSSGSVSSFDFNLPITSIPINVEQLIKSEIQKQLTPIKETQDALIEQAAELSLEHEAVKDEINNLRKLYSENYQLKKKLNNINTILSFKKLEANWNDNEAEPFSEMIIQKAFDFINSALLKFQPNVFPTARHSIQFEYEKSNGNYLEIEIFEDRFSAYSEIDDEETEYESISFNETIKLIDEFYSRI